VLGIPETCAELESLLRISVADDIQQLRVARAGFNKSGISRNNRLIERHETYFGAYWRSYDFAHSDGRANLFSHPLGPDSGANSFRHDGGEIIFNLPNGLQAYMLVDGAGDRLDKASLAIVSDPRRPDRAVASGLSCISCHIAGIHEKADEVREAVHANLKSFSAAEAEAVAAIYLPQSKMRELQSKDAGRFQAALKLTGALPSRTEPVLMLVQRFEMPLDLTTASAELGIEPAKLLKLLDTAPQSSRTLAALRVPGGTIQRQVLLDSLDTLASELKLDRAHTFAATVAFDKPPRASDANETAEPAANPSAKVGVANDSGLSSNDLTPVATIKLVAEIPDIILGKDRRWVYLLNASEGAVQRIDTQTLKLDDTAVKTVTSAERMRLSPNGRTLYVCGSPGGHNSQKESPGEFQIIPAEKFASAGTFKVPFDPWDFAPDDKGFLFATSGSAQSVPIRLVDANKRAVVANLFSNWDKTAIRLSHDGKTLCADNSHEINVFPIAGLRSKASELQLNSVGVLASRGPFEFSGDDKFVIAASGFVGRLGSNRDRNVPIAANLDRSLAIAIDPRSKLVFLATPDRQLKVYSTPDFELQHSLNLGARVHAMAVDTVGGLLYAAVNKEINRGGGDSDKDTVSNLAIYDISGILGIGGRAKPLNLPAVNVEPGFGPEGSSKSDKAVLRLDSPASRPDAASNDLKPLVTFKLGATIPDLLLAADRHYVYFLDASDGEIRRLDTESLQLDDVVVKTGPGAQRIRLTPNGKTLYAITAPDGHPREGDRGTGKVIVVPTQQFQASDRFSIPIDPLDLAPDNNGRIYILPPGQKANIQLVDARKQGIIGQPVIVWSAATLNLSRDEKSLIVGNDSGGLILPAAELSARTEPAMTEQIGTRKFEDNVGRRGTGRLALSPDGKFLAVDTGRVGRVGSSRDKQVPEVAKLDAWDAIAFDPSSARVFVSTQDKQLKVFSIPDFELQRAFNVGTRINEMALDAQRGMLYATVADKADRDVRRSPHGAIAVDLAVFDVSDLSGKPSAAPLEGTGRIRAPIPAETTPQAPAGSASDSAHRVVDLLALLNPGRDSVQGDWKVRTGELVSDSGNASRVEFQYEPPEEYDFEIQFTRAGGQGSVDQICAAGGRQFLCVLSDWESELVIGGPTTPINRDFHIVNGRRHTVLAQVRRDRVKVFVDGKQTVEWNANYQGAILLKPWALPNLNVLGVGTWQSSTVFHSVKVTEITGQGRRPATQSKEVDRPHQFPLRQWIDVLKLVDPARDAVKGNWSRTGAEVACEPEDFSRLELPVTIDGSYDLEVEFTRADGNGDVNTIFSVGSHRCMLMLSVHSGAASELAIVDGHDINDPKNPVVTRPGTLDNGHRCRALVSVRILSGGRASVDVSLNGKPYLPHWEGDPSALSLSADWALRSTKHLGIAAYHNSVTFHSVRLRMISGQASFDATPTESKKPSP